MKSKVPVFRVQMLVRGVIAYDREFGEAGTATARAREIAHSLLGKEVENEGDLLRFEVSGITIRAWMIPAGVEAQDNVPSYRSQLHEIEEATDRYIAQREETGMGTCYLLPVPRPKKPKIEVGRYVIFMGDKSETLDKSIGKIESVSATGKTVEVTGAWRSKLNVSNIYATFRHREDAEAAIDHQERSRHMEDYLWRARSAALVELIDDAE